MRTYILLLVTLSVTLALEDREDSWRSFREKRELLRRSKRRWVLSTIELTEEDKGPYPKNATKLFNDRQYDYDLTYHISGHGVDEPPLGVFSIDDHTGMVIVHKPIDREESSNFHIKFDVKDKRTGKYVDKQLAFDIEIMDINDNAPVFVKSELAVDVLESHEEGKLPVSLSATDRDKEHTDNSKIAMSVVSQDPSSPPIGIEKVPGTEIYQLNFKGCFDYDKDPTYKVIVRAKDHGTPSKSSSATVIMNIKDANNHAPVFTTTKLTADVPEMAENHEVMRLAVTDKDTHGTPAWKAVYSIPKGNEEGNYKIVTDPDTNEGILTVIKAKDYEISTLKQLEIAVMNEEPLFVCGPEGASKKKGVPSPNSVKLNITVIDVNDAPEFKRPRAMEYVKEEEDPGKVLYTPVVTDVDSEDKNIRYEIAQDPANWVTIDPKTGVVKSIAKMDRESPHVNNSIYTVLIHAIDDGKPPATGTGTLLINLGDLNDNSPFLLTKSTYMCGNRDKSVEIEGKDEDVQPFGGPFAFSLQDKSQKRMWKFDPETGMKATLKALRLIPFGNYTIPIRIEDQQGKGADDNLYLTVCDCGKGSVCLGPKGKSSALDGKAIATLFAGILAFLFLLCMCFFCACREGQHKPLYFQDEGNQTLIKYNEEGGSSICKAEPLFVMTPTSSFVAVDGLKHASIPLTQMSPGFQYGEANGTMRGQGMGMYSEDSETLRNQGMGMGAFHTDMSMQAQWKGRMNSSRGKSLRSSGNISELINRRLCLQEEDQLDFPGCHPQIYAYEGTGNSCQTLDRLSVSNCGDQLEFLENLGPKFNTLGGICRQAINEKDPKF
ncbi:hypothetical protein AGOR_G00137350 [Albula goreensis]|uniref:Cadherin domain-containing protein n=1 Tax=Albula goreensis TaxID=1534307 RepID=A0A8T3D9E3_9TELE|nr:hypothetical protein AGOR_G00137350 [Albula goreensis]